jgi:hypothetical protein
MSVSPWRLNTRPRSWVRAQVRARDHQAEARRAAGGNGVERERLLQPSPVGFAERVAVDVEAGGGRARGQTADARKDFVARQPRGQGAQVEHRILPLQQSRVLRRDRGRIHQHPVRIGEPPDPEVRREVRLLDTDDPVPGHRQRRRLAGVGGEGKHACERQQQRCG